MLRLGYGLLVLALLNVASCVIPYSAQELSRYGKIETYANDNQENLVMPQHRLKSLTIKRSQNIANLTNEKFKHCVNLQFVSRRFTLIDSRNNGYQYNYRQGKNSHLVTKDYQTKPSIYRQTSATEVSKQTENSIKLFTRSLYKVSLDKRFMSYFITAQNNGLHREYKFEHLNRGQIDSGNQVNLGANTRIVLTRGEDGINALNALKTEIDHIESCLTKN